MVIEMIPILESKLNEMTFLNKIDVYNNMEIVNKLKYALNEYGVLIYWYIMTSKQNNDDIVKFFEDNNLQVREFFYPFQTAERILAC